MKKIDRSSKVRTGFHQAKWDEPVIFELTKPGERGILVTKANPEVQKAVEGTSVLPSFLQRETAPPCLRSLSPGCCGTMPVWPRRLWAPT